MEGKLMMDTSRYVEEMTKMQEKNQKLEKELEALRIENFNLQKKLDDAKTEVQRWRNIATSK